MEFEANKLCRVERSVGEFCRPHLVIITSIPQDEMADDLPFGFASVKSKLHALRLNHHMCLAMDWWQLESLMSDKKHNLQTRHNAASSQLLSS